MANIQNLKPYKKGELSSEEAKRRGLKGDSASVKVRREKRELRELFEILLSGTITDIETNQAISKKEAIAIAQIQKTLNGDSKAFELIRDTLGEKQLTKNEMELKNSIQVKTVFITQEEVEQVKKHIYKTIAQE